MQKKSKTSKLVRRKTHGMTALSKVNKALHRAEEHHFSTGVDDGATHLSRMNMRYGLAKMHYIQDKLGFRPNATFISSPDETVTRNTPRWEAGISYGGKICWGYGKDELLFLDVMPNCCGMLVGGLNRLPKPKNILKKVYDIEQKKHYINDVRVKWDFYKGNHFIDVFKVEQKMHMKLPKYAVIMHAGCPELKGETMHGMGLYWGHSKTIMSMANMVKTPFGTALILKNKNDVEEYYRFHKFAEDFALKRRELAYKLLFGGTKKSMISNITHQGLLNQNEVTLGCQITDDRSKLYPISIRADLPSYLVKPKKNLSHQAIEDLGFNERAHRHGVYGRLREANVLPHGGGYCFNDALHVRKIFEINKKRYFEIEMLNSIGRKIVSNTRELQFAYRGREVLQKTLSMGLGELAATMHPVYTIKI